MKKEVVVLRCVSASLFVVVNEWQYKDILDEKDKLAWEKMSEDWNAYLSERSTSPAVSRSAPLVISVKKRTSGVIWNLLAGCHHEQELECQRSAPYSAVMKKNRVRASALPPAVPPAAVPVIYQWACQCRHHAATTNLPPLLPMLP